MMFKPIGVSIPQAVGTIAIKHKDSKYWGKLVSFNTASGRYYCNGDYVEFTGQLSMNSVSIPQAVGTIAIVLL